MTLITRTRGRMIGGAKDNAPGLKIINASKLTGQPVINAVGDSLGEIHDIMLDMATGRIAYAVLEFGGFLGLGNKLSAVPWGALTYDAENGCFILNVDKQRLREAPAFDRDDWPTMAQSRWVEEVHEFYEAEPFWQYQA